jgi:hypothetical protein
MPKFYDSITERWYEMPEKATRERTRFERFVDELDKLREGAKKRHDEKLWEAVTATATASQMSTETECPDGSG